MKGKQNPVAKYCRQFNRSHVERDRTKYFRKEKHKKGASQMDRSFFCLGF